MVTEVRKIILSQAELDKALNSFRRVKPDFLPPGRILYCRPVDAQPSIGVEMVYGNTKREMEISVPMHDFVEVMVKFCVENNICLPRQGTKSAGFVEGNAMLHIELEAEMG